MEKISILILVSLIFCTFLSACNIQPSNSMIKSQRRFAKYIEPPQNGNFVDLSEGPRLQYDAHFGPQNLNFDFKIINPY